MSLADYWVPDGPEQGLHLPTGLTYEKWTEIGSVLVKMEKGIMWALGDHWAYGELHYGERAYQAAALGYAVSTLRTAARVAKRFPQGQRNPEVPWSHHREVSALPPKQAQELLEQAEEQNLSSHEVRVRVRAKQSRTALETEEARAGRARARAVEGPGAHPPTPYPILIADPPWGEMSLEDICDFEPPVGTQAVCFLWAPVTYLPDGLSVLAAWGFVYRAHVIWPAVGFPSIENFWVDVQHLLVLIGGRGELLPTVRPRSLLEFGAANRSRNFKLRGIVEEMYPGLAIHEAWIEPASIS